MARDFIGAQNLGRFTGTISVITTITVDAFTRRIFMRVFFSFIVASLASPPQCDNSIRSFITFDVAKKVDRGWTRSEKGLAQFHAQKPTPHEVV